MSLTTQGLLAELDTTLPQATESWRSAALRRIADLFVASAENYNDAQVAQFGEVIGRLILNTGRLQLAELSDLLAKAPSAPVNVVGLLAWHIDIAVCGPVLERAAASGQRSRPDRRRPHQHDHADEDRRSAATQRSRHGRSAQAGQSQRSTHRHRQSENARFRNRFRA
jgi:hypothetical protein